MRSFANDMFVLLKEEARILIGRNEISAGWFRLKRTAITVSRETDIVIEGAPSSGNSFALVAFESAQNRRMRIAHHHHLPFQVTLACRDHIPCIVLIRHPLDAVVSRVSRYGYYQPQTLQAVLWVNYSLRHWNMFYERALEWRSNFLVCDFRELISDYASVIERVNAKFKPNSMSPARRFARNRYPHWWRDSNRTRNARYERPSSRSGCGRKPRFGNPSNAPGNCMPPSTRNHV